MWTRKERKGKTGKQRREKERKARRYVDTLEVLLNVKMSEI